MRQTAFNGEMSKWDVSKVTNMNGMFQSATSFNGDISKWDVSRAIYLDEMFLGATSFNQQLCGAAWVNSKADKDDMFEGSSGSIASRLLRSLTLCDSAALFGRKITVSSTTPLGYA